MFTKLHKELDKKLKEPAYQHEGEDYYVGICAAQQIADQVEKEFYKENPIFKYALMYAEHIKKYGIDISEKWETATQNATALNEAYMRGRQDERDGFDRLKDNNGWIPCSERLPKEDDFPEQRYRVLASCSDGIVRNATIKSLLTEDEIHISRGNEFTYVAWKPLSDPYIPKGE